MSRVFAAGCAVALLAAVACQSRETDPAPSDGPAAAASGRTVEDSVRALEQAWADAVRTRDSAALERLVAPTFVLVGGDAAAPPVARAVWMENTLQRLRVDSIRLTPADVTTRGDTAIARLRFSWVGQFMTTPPFRDSTELTDTWVRSDGEWRVHRRVMAR